MKLNDLQEATYHRQSPIVDIIKDKIDPDKEDFWNSHGYTHDIDSQDLPAAIEELSNFLGEVPKRGAKGSKIWNWYITRTSASTKIQIWYDLVSSQYKLTIRHY